MASSAPCAYYDIDAILSEEEVDSRIRDTVASLSVCLPARARCLQRVTAEFAIDANGLGFLDPARDPNTQPDVRESPLCLHPPMERFQSFVLSSRTGQPALFSRRMCRSLLDPNWTFRTG